MGKDPFIILYIIVIFIRDIYIPIVNNLLLGDGIESIKIKYDPISI